jgi:hypothetical protein
LSLTRLFVLALLICVWVVWVVGEQSRVHEEVRTDKIMPDTMLNWYD